MLKTKHLYTTLYYYNDSYKKKKKIYVYYPSRGVGVNDKTFII